MPILHWDQNQMMEDNTLGPAYCEFGYNEHRDTKSKKLSIELTSSH